MREERRYTTLIGVTNYSTIQNISESFTIINVELTRDELVHAIEGLQKTLRDSFRNEYITLDTKKEHVTSDKQRKRMREYYTKNRDKMKEYYKKRRKVTVDVET